MTTDPRHPSDDNEQRRAEYAVSAAAAQEHAHDPAFRDRLADRLADIEEAQATAGMSGDEFLAATEGP